MAVVVFFNLRSEPCPSERVSVYLFAIVVVRGESREEGVPAVSSFEIYSVPGWSHDLGANATGRTLLYIEANKKELTTSSLRKEDPPIPFGGANLRRKDLPGSRENNPLPQILRMDNRPLKAHPRRDNPRQRHQRR